MENQDRPSEVSRGIQERSFVHDNGQRSIIGVVRRGEWK